jgi:hypothetical protein
MASKRTVIAPLLTAASVIAFGGCTLPGSAAAATTVGDTCLVGKWTLINETNQRGYSFSNVPVMVQGFAGATLTITSAGDEKEVFQGSAPLVGTLGDNRQLVITVGGSADFQIQASGGKYSETGKVTQLPTNATVAGQTVTNYHSSDSPGNGTYECTGSTLTITTSGGNQTDYWSKG